MAFGYLQWMWCHTTTDFWVGSLVQFRWLCGFLEHPALMERVIASRNGIWIEGNPSVRGLVQLLQRDISSCSGVICLCETVSGLFNINVEFYISSMSDNGVHIQGKVNGGKCNTYFPCQNPDFSCFGLHHFPLKFYEFWCAKAIGTSAECFPTSHGIVVSAVYLRFMSYCFHSV